MTYRGYTRSCALSDSSSDRATVRILNPFKLTATALMFIAGTGGSNSSCWCASDTPGSLHYPVVWLSTCILFYLEAVLQAIPYCMFQLIDFDATCDISWFIVWVTYPGAWKVLPQHKAISYWQSQIFAEEVSLDEHVLSKVIDHTYFQAAREEGSKQKGFEDSLQGP